MLVVVDIGGWVTNAGGGAVINAGEWWPMHGDCVGVVVDEGPRSGGQHG